MDKLQRSYYNEVHQRGATGALDDKGYPSHVVANGIKLLSVTVM